MLSYTGLGLFDNLMVQSYGHKSNEFSNKKPLPKKIVSLGVICLWGDVHC